MTAGAGIYRVVVAFLVHFDAKALEFLPGISLHRVGLLEAWQGRRAASKEFSIKLSRVLADDNSDDSEKELSPSLYYYIQRNL